MAAVKWLVQRKREHDDSDEVTHPTTMTHDHYRMQTVGCLEGKILIEGDPFVRENPIAGRYFPDKP
jgi:hypothetical protein